MAIKIQLRRDTAANWTSVNPILADGEEGHETDTSKRKIGDGVTAWTSLSYIFDSASETLTSLTLAANTLTYTDENGAQAVYDLSIYLDDTNLARLVSGTTNPTTGLVTFTRDDSSTFTIDMSPFLDGISDHGGLSGLSDDDHTQYHNDLRGDLRYYTQTQINGQQSAQDIAIGLNTAKVSFPEAPTDGQTYGRQNSGWAPVVGGSSQWTPVGAGIHYSSGFVGIDTLAPTTNLQIGQHDNDGPPDARLLNAGMKIYGGTANNNGTAQIGLLESVPSTFPGDYGYYLRYSGSSNLLELISVQAGVETVVWDCNRGTGVSTYYSDLGGDGNQALNFADANTPQGLMTLGQFQRLTDAVKVSTVTAANVNTGPAVFNSFTTTDVLGSTLGQFTFATNGITPNFNGVVDIEFSLHLDGNTTRARPAFRWLHNGNVGPWNAGTYIRNSGGDSQSSGIVVATIPVVANLPIQIQHDNLNTVGTVQGIGGGEFTVKRRR